MPVLWLADHAVFDDTDDAGVILDTRKGVYLSLNGVATAMLQAALRFDSVDKVISELRGRIDASDDTLKEGFDALVQDLAAHALLGSAQPEGESS